jgi:hypothetical protein
MNSVKASNHNRTKLGARLTKTVGSPLLGLVFFLGVFPANANAARILILGDSLSVPSGIGLGNRLDHDLRKKGHQPTTIASCGSAPASYREDTSTYKTRCGYLKRSADGSETYLPYDKIKKTSGVATPKLHDLVRESNPDLAVIQQGTNLFRLILDHPTEGRSRVAGEVESLLLNLHHRAPQTGCVWIGPPKLSKYYGSSGAMVAVTSQHLQSMIEGIQQGIAKAEAVTGKKCAFHDSRSQTEAPMGDGIHHWRAQQTEAWVRAAAQVVDEALSSTAPKTLAGSSSSASSGSSSSSSSSGCLDCTVSAVSPLDASLKGLQGDLERLSK